MMLCIVIQLREKGVLDGNLEGFIYSAIAKVDGNSGGFVYSIRANGKEILRIYVKYSREGRRKHKLGRNYVQYSGKSSGGSI